MRFVAGWGAVLRCCWPGRCGGTAGWGAVARGGALAKSGAATRGGAVAEILLPGRPIGKKMLAGDALAELLLAGHLRKRHLLPASI